MGQTTLDIQDELQALKRTVGKCNDEIANLVAKNADLEAANNRLEKQNLHLEEQSNHFEDRQLDDERAISELQRLVGKRGTAKTPPDDDGGFVSMNLNAYTFLYTSSVRSGPYFAGLTSCAMQYTVFSLFLLDLLKTTNVPPGVANIVRACQIMAIVIAFLVETDMPRALRAVIYREGFQEMNDAFDEFTPWKFYLSNALMGFQGLLSKVVAFFLIIFADNVFDLLLNFTAIMFVSELDEIVFMLSKAGFLGRHADRLAKKIHKMKLPQNPPEGMLEYVTTLLYGLTLAIAFVAFAFIARQQDSQDSLAEFVKVEFGDQVDATLGLFSGCYEKQLTDGWDARVRYVPTQPNRGPGEFEYCPKDGFQTWVFANETSETSCNRKFVLRSAEERSTSFDLLDAKGDQWLLRTGNPISKFQLGEISPDRFEIECGNIAINGSSTNSEELCPVLTLNIDDIGFSASYDWARSFVFLVDSDEEIVQFYQHPVFIAESEPGPEGYEVLFFAGRRWVLARTANLLTQENDTSRMDVVSLFESSGFWLITLDENTIADHRLAYLSEAVGQANDRGTPLGLQWYNARYADGVAFPFADISRPVDASLRCGKCNSRSNPCLYEGICNADGSCTCRHGASGKLCESKPLGDGECNPYFNTRPDEYDGGDCCVGTCSAPNCGVNGTHFSFGQNLKRIGIGFPHCADPKMVPLTIQLQTEIEKAQTVFFESYTIEVVCEGGSKVPLRVSLDPDIVGLLSETLYIEDKSDSCLLRFIGIRSTSGLNISYQVLDGAESSSESVMLMREERGVTSDNEFVLPALYSRCLKDALVDVVDENHLYTGSYQDRAFAWLSQDVPKNAECSSDEEYLMERYALVALSIAEEADESWISSSDHCLWPRVKCDGSRVVEYTYDGLTNGYLNGTLAPEFTLLQNLERLDLAANTFSPGTIPTEISELTALTALVMPGNQRSGNIPSTLFKLSALEELTMAGNALSGSVPTEVGQLSCLWSLTLFQNALSGSIPSEIGSMNALVSLEISENALTSSIPSELGNMSSLTALSLMKNALSGSLPSELGNMSSLVVMQLSTNALSGTLPSEVGNLSALTKLQLQRNALSGTLPSEVGKLTSLQRILLHDNGLSGTLPPEVWSLKGLTDLKLHNNALSGTISSDVGNLRSLTSLRLADNLLNETLPSEIGLLANLQYLYLSNNMLSGSIPSDVGLLGNLLFLSVTNNLLNETLPSEIGQLTNLRYLLLEDMTLSGSLPTEVGIMSSLSMLALRDNSLSGTLPSEIANLTSLAGVYLQSNTLSGTVPSEVGTMSALTHLILAHNILSGALPSELGLLSDLQALNLGDNLLNETLPSEIGRLLALTMLSLNENAFSGKIPSEIGNLGALKEFLLFTNALSGEIPSEIGLLGNLLHLDMRNNTLSGTLPSEIGLLTHLGILNLGDNNLSGPLPTEILQLTNLRELELSGNRFSEEDVNNVMDVLFPVFSCNETTVAIVLTTDDWPEDTRWEITTDDGTVVASGGNYTVMERAHDEKACVPFDACIFLLLDQYGDGGPEAEITRLGKFYKTDASFTDMAVVDICA